ncbi:thioredoxin domain-containing protein [Leeuwenhoekiella sp. H156]|uniref:thioredoxin domain-containing protein n=1 Tax=Leeuwenhoekiella sp. H156 TaxID=3450128 RepID=UPI003FA413A8
MKNILYNSLFILSICFCLTGCKKDSKEQKEYAHTNALINETSPYLLKHAHNPVDWNAWSDTLFDYARKEKKLVLLSIGYASCHWCTVMEEETFSNDSVAAFMNTHFINVKVDREERPDVDHVYMTALQLMRGSGGWPLNMILLPDGNPVYGGTYHTREEWMTSIKLVDSLYKKDPERAQEYASEVTRRIQELNTATNSASVKTIDNETTTSWVKNWQKDWDLKQGGFGNGQKFMLPSGLSYLLDFAYLNQDAETLKFTELTLNKIALGGVYDHLEGGFYRYSTDAEWKVPHYEKMLYDNAQLISLYSKAYKIFKNPLYKQRITETIDFLNARFKTSGGEYIAALDADLDGEEGAYYVFTQEELAKVSEQPLLFKKYYNLDSQRSNTEEAYNLYKTKTDSLFAKENNLSTAELKRLTSSWKKDLNTLKAKRKFPLKDDKIIISWNALMIESLADAFSATGTFDYLKQAEETYKVLTEKALKNGQLVHSYKSGSKPVAGFLDDYTYLSSAGLKLYTLTGNLQYLEDAKELTVEALSKFRINDSSFYKYNSQDNLIAPIVITNDGVMPSANAVMANNLLLLANIYYDDDLAAKSNAMLNAMIPEIEIAPDAYAHWQSVSLKRVFPFYDVALTGPQSQNFSRDLNSRYLPNTLIVFEETETDIPIFESRYVAGKTLIYICEQRTCKYPVSTVSEALGLMNHQFFP